LIGTDASGLFALGNHGAGLLVQGATGVTIGGATPGELNTIGYNVGAGLRLIDPAAARNDVRGNLLINNLGGGIDVGSDGVTLNDLGDVDGFLNFPVITAAEVSGGDLVVTGFGRPGIALDLYLSTPAIGPLVGYGQGEQYLASLVEGSAADQDSTSGSYGPEPVGGVLVGNDATSRFRFALPLASLPPEVQTGSLLTAVALGSTSEFGNAVAIGRWPATRTVRLCRRRPALGQGAGCAKRPLRRS
jgi:hypothetical protein